MPRRARRHFNEKNVGTLRSDDSRGRSFADATLPGFTIRAFPESAPVFFVRYTLPNGIRKSVRIGRYGPLTLRQARDRAKAILADVALGGDPAARRKRAQEMPSWSKWVETYIERIAPRRKNIRNDVRYLSLASERWGSVSLDRIGREDVQKLMEHIYRNGAMTPEARRREQAAGRPRVTPATCPVSANRALQAIRPCFEEAVRTGLIGANPADRIKRYLEAPPRARVLEGTEIERFLRAVAEETDPHARAALRLLLETGARLSEVLKAKWEDLDLDANPPTWRIPSPKVGYPQIQPLAASTVALLRTLPHGGPYIILGRSSDSPRTDLKGPWTRALERAGLLKAGLTVHDIRRTVGLAVARAAGLHVASKALRHSSIGITEKTYAPLAIEEIRQGLEKGTSVLTFDPKAKRKGKAR